MTHISNIPFDILFYITNFLQRTDQITLKILNKHFNKNCKITMDLNTELNLYTKTIEELSYSWFNDTRYINIETLDSKYDILKKYVVFTDLWFFDFNAEFDIVPDTYVIVCLTTVKHYSINLTFTDKNNNIQNTTHKPSSNKIIQKFETSGKLKVNCNEIKKRKHYDTFQYIMCIPLYYWEIIKGNNNIIADWKKQIKFLSRYGYNYIRAVWYYQ